jgi:CarboxypepD_reg-like domain/TonB-dependent Receptor Plug Domain
LRYLYVILSTVCLLSTICRTANAQHSFDYKLGRADSGKYLSELLREVEQRENVRFFFISEWLQSLIIPKISEETRLDVILNSLFSGTELTYLVMDEKTLVIVMDPTNLINHKQAIDKAIAEKISITQMAIGDSKTSRNSSRLTISGRVVDSRTAEPIPQVNIQVSDSRYNTSTDGAGYFKIELAAPGAYLFSLSSVNYDPEAISLMVYESGELNVDLEKETRILDEVIIEAGSTQDVSTSRIGRVDFGMKEIKRAPAFLGEVDLVKQVQLLPGVTTAGEAASGFNVRGGSVDQNLLLYDGLPVFNSSHAFGFLTSFNSEAIREVSFFNGGIPAKFGGRISSVLDIHSKDGSFEKWSGKIGIGMITGNIMLSGPLKKDKTAFIASMRSTYSDWLLNSIRTNYADLSKSSVFFYDATLKITHKVNNQTELSLVGYSTKDSFRLFGDSTYGWTNLQGLLKLKHKFSETLDSEFLFGANSYGYNVVNNDFLTASELSYKINTTSIKADFDYLFKNGSASFGWQVLHYQFNPGRLEPKSTISNAKPVDIEKQFALENAFYVSRDWALKNRFFVDAGLRIPTFFNFGPAHVNVYKDNEPKSTTGVIDTLNFASGEIVKLFAGLEPRISLRWAFNASSSLKFGYNRIYQYLHLVTNTTAVTPVDIWQPSGYHFRPQHADQISLGYFKNIGGEKYTTSVEAFYKDISNIADFKDGAKLILNPALETELLQGKGRSFGFETTFGKNSGRFSWSLNYTFSRSLRQISGVTPQESINGGKEYASNFDQPHIINYSWKYSLSKRIFFTGIFTYRTGRPITIPLAGFQLENTTVTYFSDRNQYRIPDYHRLDLALSIEGNHKRKKIAEGTWVISVYNVYGRQNPYTIFFENSTKGVPVPYQLSIVGTVFPSISYNLKF